jgi:hypothetical protein
MMLLTCPDMTYSVLVFAYRINSNNQNYMQTQPPNERAPLSPGSDT